MSTTFKSILTPEQSATLISKGISADKTSFDSCATAVGSAVRTPIHPIFTLADILSLLPKHIGDFGNLMMDFNNLYGEWDVCYELSEYMQSETELIDALFSILCWAIEKDFLTN